MRAYDEVPVRVQGEDVFVYVNINEKDDECCAGSKYKVKLSMRIDKPIVEGHQVPRFSLLKAEAQGQNFDPGQFIIN